jgi:glycerophosphoryl diester phosphodiesterase
MSAAEGIAVTGFPRWIAHRGAGKLAPENTLAAFRVGASFGYSAFECDVKLSADGVPFLLHDATLDRTTPESGIAGERPWNALSRIDAGGWHSRAFAGEPIPSLELVMRWVQRNGFALNVEIKPTPGAEHATGEAVAHACARWWQGTAAPLLFSSFRPEALAAAQAAAPAIPRALLVDTPRPDALDTARALGCVAMVTNHTMMDAALVAALHGAGMRALCYTVNDPADARRLLGLGVDGLITDAVDRFSPAGDGAVRD